MLLVIGYGNSLRRDDGAGLLLAEALTAAWQGAGHAVALVVAHQLMPEIAAEIADLEPAVVLFVDTAIAPPMTGETAPACWPTRLHAEDAAATLGHHLDPTAVLFYADRLFAARPAAWLLQVPGYDFDHGEGLGEATRAAVDQALAAAEPLWAQLTAGAEL